MSPSELFVAPGQVWTWCFPVSDGTYFFDNVTENMNELPTITLIKKGQSFLVIANDVPRAQIYAQQLAISECTPFRNPRWHIALLNSSLVWVEHDFLMYAKLEAHVHEQV